VRARGVFLWERNEFYGSGGMIGETESGYGRWGKVPLALMQYWILVPDLKEYQAMRGYAMISREQAILMASNKAQEDFPNYEGGPLLSAENEDQCWYISLRLSHATEQMDVLYGVYYSGRSWIATLFDSVPHQMMSDDEQAMKCAADQMAVDLAEVEVLDVSVFGRISQDASF